MEKMVTGRKLPCDHIFHQFCIIKLIQSGNKKCPMCRQVINHSNRIRNGAANMLGRREN